MSRAVLIGTLVAVIAVWAIFAFSGDGSFKRMTTFSGVYSICKPDGYDVVCFLDADGAEGGVFCLPLSQVGGKCHDG